MTELPWDYSRCRPKWPEGLPCDRCMRHVERISEKFRDSSHPISVSDFSQDSKGDQVKECRGFIDEEKWK